MIRVMVKYLKGVMTMECDTYREWISLWLDDRLAQAEIQQVETHVATCPDCRTALDTLRRVDRWLAITPMMPPAPGFAIRFQAKLVARHRRRRTWAGLITLGLATLAMLLATIALLAITSLQLWGSLSASGWPGQGIGLLLSLGKAGTTLFNLVWLITGALVRGLQHPVCVAYAVVTVILAVTWAQIVKQRVFAYRPATN